MKPRCDRRLFGVGENSLDLRHPHDHFVGGVDEELELLGRGRLPDRVKLGFPPTPLRSLTSICRERTQSLRGLVGLDLLLLWDPESDLRENLLVLSREAPAIVLLFRACCGEADYHVRRAVECGVFAAVGQQDR